MGLNIGIIVTFDADNDYRPAATAIAEAVHAHIDEMLERDALIDPAFSARHLEVSYAADRYVVDLRVGSYRKLDRAQGGDYDALYAAMVAGIFDVCRADGLVLTTYFAP